MRALISVGNEWSDALAAMFRVEVSRKSKSCVDDEDGTRSASRFVRLVAARSEATILSFSLSGGRQPPSRGE